MHCFLNGEFIDDNENFFSGASRGAMYGDGCFTTLRSYKGRFLHFDKHFNRLVEGAEYLGFNLGFTEEQLRDVALTLIKKNELENTDSVLRIQFSRSGSGGFSNLSDRSVCLVTNSLLPTIKPDITLKTVNTRVIPEKSLSRKVKLTQSLNYIKAMEEANQKGFDDALMVTIDDFISETAIANIFWVKDDQVFTPSSECDLLPGVTRSVVLDLFFNQKIEVNHGKYRIEELKKAEAVFCCNSLREIMPVSIIDQDEFDAEHEVIQKIKEQFESYKTLHLK